MAVEADDQVVGLSQSFLRHGYWVLSLLGVQPGLQGQGVGTELLARSMATLSPGSRGTVQASRDPAAIGLYHRAGFALHPAVTARGRLRRPLPPIRDRVIREGDPGDLAAVDQVDRHVRSAPRTDLVRHMLDDVDNILLVASHGRSRVTEPNGHARRITGYAVARSDRLVSLAAEDEDSAKALLGEALRRADGTFQVMWLTAGQQWALEVATQGGLELHGQGPVMVWGMPGPPAPYVPSGGLG